MEGTVELTVTHTFFPLRTLEAILKAPESIAPSMAVADSDRSWSLMTAAMAALAAVAVVTVTMRAGRSDKREPLLG
jgi:hypothetical protein